MRAPRPKSAPRGVTLLEMMISIILFVLVFGLAVPFFRYQARSVSANSGRLDALQNARYAQNAIDRELRMAGAGIVNDQPLLVQADAFAVTFNADLVTTDAADADAIYFDPSVDSNATISMSAASPITLPRTGITYPDSDYVANSIPSRAETISFWLERDTLGGRSDQYVLYRRVNAMPARVVAKSLVVPAGRSFFTYFRPDSTGRLDSIPGASLPLRHSAPRHGAAADTGRAAWVDSIRVVRVLAEGLFHDPAKGDVTRLVQSSTRILNAGMVRATTCGDRPLAPSGATAVLVPPVDPDDPIKVRISWNESADQESGEKDVERYMIFKRKLSTADWGEPRASISASQTSYTLDDTDLRTGTWLWAVVAQDCSPSNSALATTNQLTITIP